MAQMNEVAARIMEHLCEHAAHGYTQGNRWGNGSTESIEVDGKSYSFAGGDRDCSSAVISAYQAAGLNVSATYTGNMKSAFLATGLFEWHGMDFTAQRGDIYLNEANHTAMCVSAVPDLLAEFCIAENGTAYGTEGDQTGWEAYVHGYYDYPWDGILHFTGGEASGGASGGSPTGGGSGGSQPSGGEWQGDMVGRDDTTGAGDDYAGVFGKPMRYIAVEGAGTYQVHDKGGSWWPKVSRYDLSDEDGGMAGAGNPIDALRIDDPTVCYQTHNLGGDWNDVMKGTKDTGGSSDDFAGDMGVAQDAVRIWRESGGQPRYNVFS